MYCRFVILPKVEKFEKVLKITQRHWHHPKIGE
jgi:hypothetical protein